MHLAIQNNEPLECPLCGDQFPKRPWMIPVPRRPPRDAAARGPQGGADGGADDANRYKGKGKGKGKNGQGDRPKGRGKGSTAKGGTETASAQDFPSLPRAAAKARAKAKAEPSPQTAAPTAPWARPAATTIKVDP